MLWKEPLSTIEWCITPMQYADHHRHCSTFLNPSLAERFDCDPLAIFDPRLSILENCRHSEAQGIADVVSAIVENPQLQSKTARQ
jgi:hypothetical protein